jgi:hypothetical protein
MLVRCQFKRMQASGRNKAWHVLSGYTQAKRTPELRLDVGKDVALAWRYQDVPNAQLPLRACQEAQSSFSTTMQLRDLHMRSRYAQEASLGCAMVVRMGGCAPPSTRA